MRSWRIFAPIFTAVSSIALATSSRLDVIELPTGFFPEGIALADEWTVYVGSLGEDGSIWKGDLSTGKGEVVVSDAGGQAVGLTYDKRSDYLYVAGGDTGSARIYDAASNFTLVAEISLAGTNDTLVNDVILTATAAYFTDSFQAQLYSVPLKRYSGKLANGADTVASTIPLSSEFTMLQGTFNANGIEVTDDDQTLIVANIASGELFTVDPETGKAALIDVGGVILHGDGLVLRKNTLWVVENTVVAGEVSQVSEVSLSADLSCGAVAPRALANELFIDPTTAVRKGNSLYVVVANFQDAAEDRETTTYNIVRVDRDDGQYVCPAE